MPVFTPSQVPIPNVFNFSPQNLKIWRKALAGVRAGAKNSRVLFIGDSETFGINASGSLNWPSVTDAVASQLLGSGVQANANGFCGFSVAGATTGSRLGTDPRMVAGSWNAGQGVGTTLGGSYLFCSSGSTPFTFTPQVNVDTFSIFYNAYGSGGSAHVQATGGTQGTINETSDPAGMNTKTVTAGSLGSNTLSLTYVSGSTVYVEGVEAYNSALKSVNIMNAGWWGSSASDWNNSANNTTSPIPLLKYLAPDLTIITCGGVEWQNGTAVSTFTANVQAVITVAKISGDVILIPDAPNTNNISTQPNYVNALYQLAATNGCVLIDNYARWVSYSVSNAVGLYADTIHPTATGYADQAQMIRNVLLSV